MKARIAWGRHAQACRICAAALRHKTALCPLGASLHGSKTAAERLADVQAGL